MVPLFAIVATALSVLVHVPPNDGEIVVVEPTHIDDGPFITVTGAGLTVTGSDAIEEQPTSEVKMKVTTPSATPVTTPPLVIVAIASSLLSHVPPVEGDKVVVLPIQISEGPVMFTVGLGMMAILVIGSDAQPADDVKVNMAVP